ADLERLICLERYTAAAHVYGRASSGAGRTYLINMLRRRVLANVACPFAPAWEAMRPMRLTASVRPNQFVTSVKGAFAVSLPLVSSRKRLPSAASAFGNQLKPGVTGTHASNRAWGVPGSNTGRVPETA